MIIIQGMWLSLTYSQRSPETLPGLSLRSGVILLPAGTAKSDWNFKNQKGGGSQGLFQWREQRLQSFTGNCRRVSNANPLREVIHNSLTPEQMLPRLLISNYIGVSPSGKAPGSGPGIPRFESLHPRFLLRHTH